MRVLLVLFFLCVGVTLAQEETQTECIDSEYEFPSRISDVAVKIEIEVSPNSEILAVATEMGVYLYDTEKLALIQYIEKGSHSFDISWSPDNQSLALASYVFGLDTIHPSSQLQIWDLDEIQLSTATETDYVAWSPDGEFVATNQINDGLGGLVIWDANTLEPIVELETPLLEQIVWLPDSSGVIATYERNTYLFWQWENDVEYVTIENNINHVASQIHDSQIAFVTGYLQIEIWDIDSEEMITAFQAPHNIFTAEWSPDGTSIAFGTREGLFIWQPFESETPIDYTDIAPPTYRIAWLPTGKSLFFSDFDGSVYRWDTERECVTGKIDITEDE